MPFQIVHNDIMRMDTDAIVAAAMGETAITEGGELPARYVIYVEWPVWHGGNCGERELLTETYETALRLAKAKGCSSVAFPLVPANNLGYPRRETLVTAKEAVQAFLKSEEMDVYLVVPDRAEVSLEEDLRADILGYMDTHLERFDNQTRGIERSTAKPRSMRPNAEIVVPEFLRPQAERRRDHALEELLGRPAETFSQMLLRLIDEKGFTDVEVYKRANMDRKLFSKSRSNPGYSPKKQTVMALAVALRLSAEEAGKLLESAGYTFSDARKQDIIVRYFLERGQYDIYAINEALFCFGQPLLGV